MGLFRKKEQSVKKNTEEQNAVLTVYSCCNKTSDIQQMAAEIFSETMIDCSEIPDGGFLITLQDHSQVTFHVMSGSSQISAHTSGMANFFMQSPLKNKKIKEGAIRQILLFNCVIGIEFTVNEDSDRTEYLIAAVYLLAVKLKGFVLHPNMYLFQADRRLLISIDGKTDLEEFYPIADSSLLDKDIPEEQADIDRKMRSIQKCRQKGLNCIEHLKAAVYESECKIPTKEEIIHRLSGIFAAAVCSEACNYEGEKAEEMVKGMLESLEEQYQISDWLSNEEREYTSHPLDFPKLHAKFGWRYECCAVLLWALNLMELGEPVKICDAAEIGKIMWNHDFNSLMEKAALRSKGEILDMQDLIFRYDWACVDARINQKRIEAVDGEIVYEWHYALNWLTGADGITDWDKIKPNT
ncbi:MAG: DUF4272 domain-containing protein [Lachnospiraceae bacterium]|nr:DUF4272 domain-containing protein [Lachnospiraceae bacterium]